MYEPRGLAAWWKLCLLNIEPLPRINQPWLCTRKIETHVFGKLQVSKRNPWFKHVQAMSTSVPKHSYTVYRYRIYRIPVYRIKYRIRIIWAILAIATIATIATIAPIYAVYDALTPFLPRQIPAMWLLRFQSKSSAPSA